MIKTVTYIDGKMFKETILEPFANKQKWVVSLIQDHIESFNPLKQPVKSVTFSDADEAYRFYEEATKPITRDTNNINRFIIE